MLQHAIVVAVSLVASTITYPHEVIRARLQFDRGGELGYNGLWDAFAKTVKSAGLWALQGFRLFCRAAPQCIITFSRGGRSAAASSRASPEQTWRGRSHIGRRAPTSRGGVAGAARPVAEDFFRRSRAFGACGARRTRRLAVPRAARRWLGQPGAARPRRSRDRSRSQSTRRWVVPAHDESQPDLLEVLLRATAAIKPHQGQRLAVTADSMTPRSSISYCCADWPVSVAPEGATSKYDGRNPSSYRCYIGSTDAIDLRREVLGWREPGAAARRMLFVFSLALLVVLVVGLLRLHIRGDAAAPRRDRHAGGGLPVDVPALPGACAALAPGPSRRAPCCGDAAARAWSPARQRALALCCRTPPPRRGDVADGATACASARARRPQHVGASRRRSGNPRRYADLLDDAAAAAGDAQVGERLRWSSSSGSAAPEPSAGAW